MKRSYFLLFVAVFFFVTSSVVFAQLVYDPETNSYVNRGSTSNSDDSSEGRVSENDQDDEDSEPAGDQISSVGSTNNTSDTDSDETEITSSPTATRSSNDRDGTLEYMHVQVDDNADTLRDLLQDNYEDLSDQAAELLDEGSTSRLDSLQCLGVIDNDFDYLNDIKETREDLANQIQIVMTDLHSEITALESKIDDDLLTSLDRNLQVGSLQNKIDAYNSEYTNIIEMYYELSLDEVANADELVQDEIEDYQEVVDLYDERVALFLELEEKYTDFLQETSFAGTTMESLSVLIQALEGYYKSVYMDKLEWEVLSRIPANNISFIETVRAQSKSAFSVYFATNMSTVLNGLYPVERLQSINSDMTTLRGLYKTANGSFDCQAIVQNSAISTMSQNISSDIDATLDGIELAVQNYTQSGGTVPQDLDGVRELLTKTIEEHDLSDVTALIAQESARIQNRALVEGVNRLVSPNISQKVRIKRSVRQFLQEMYTQHMQNGRLEQFDQKLRNAYSKVVDALGDSPNPATQQILEAIGEVIVEFM